MPFTCATVETLIDFVISPFNLALHQRPDRARVTRTQVCAPDHRPRSDPEVVKPGRDKGRDAPLRLLGILHLVAHEGTSYSRSARYGFGSMATCRSPWRRTHLQHGAARRRDV